MLREAREHFVTITKLSRDARTLTIAIWGSTHNLQLPRSEVQVNARSTPIHFDTSLYGCPESEIEYVEESCQRSRQNIRLEMRCSCCLLALKGNVLCMSVWMQLQCCMWNYGVV